MARVSVVGRSVVVMSQATVPMSHPWVVCGAAVSAAVGAAEASDPRYLRTDEKARLLETLTAQIARLEGLRLELLAVADDVAERDGARTAGAWLAHRACLDQREGRRLQRLAEACDRRPVVLDALKSGRLSRGHVETISDALAALPASAGAAVRGRAEARLVEDASEFAPRELRLLGRRVLEVVAPEVAEDDERRALERDERRAQERMRIVTRDLGDGLSRAVMDLPTVSMDLLLTHLHAFASPRRDHLEPAESLGQVPQGGQVEQAEPGGWSRRLAEAFCALLERMPTGGVPEHGGDAATLIVTIEHSALLRDVGAASLATGGRISVGEARRLACNAGILPMVLGGGSLPLDVGRKQRYFQPAQRRAMVVRDRRCRTAGCDIPAAWCEAHHLRPWSKGGRTDLADGLLLCRFHHHRAHDARYDTSRLSNGDVRFHRRR